MPTWQDDDPSRSQCIKRNQRAGAFSYFILKFILHFGIYWSDYTSLQDCNSLYISCRRICQSRWDGVEFAESNVSLRLRLFIVAHSKFCNSRCQDQVLCFSESCGVFFKCERELMFGVFFVFRLHSLVMSPAPGTFTETYINTTRKEKRKETKRHGSMIAVKTFV
jgi:hypothetical protein